MRGAGVIIIIIETALTESVKPAKSIAIDAETLAEPPRHLRTTYAGPLGKGVSGSFVRVTTSLPTARPKASGRAKLLQSCEDGGTLNVVLLVAAAVR
jgi:hypothetical protein